MILADVYNRCTKKEKTHGTSPDQALIVFSVKKKPY